MVQAIRKKINKDYFYIMPAALFVGIFFITSVLFTLYISFFEWDGFSAMKFVGIDNYIKLFKDPNFMVSIVNTLIWVGCSLIISLALPLFLAILITKSSFSKLFMNVFYFPNAISPTVSAIIFTTLLSIYGLPQIAGLLGFEEAVCNWLAIPKVNTFIMIGTGIWQGIGLNLVLFIIGLKNIDRSPIEAAEIEGVNTIQMYTKVIFPLMKGTFIVVLLMALVNSFKVFDAIWVMTKGGPYRSSETLALTMYQESFVNSRLGAGAAVAIVLTIIILIISYFNLRNTFKTDER